MIYRFKITSTEVKGFERDIEIEHEQTWLDLHYAIQESVGYDNSQMASFYQMGADGKRGLEIVLIEMNTGDDDNMNVVAMDVAMIREFSSKENAELIYVFDFFSDRFFNISLIEKGISKSTSDYPVCLVSKGVAPTQIMMDTENSEYVDFSQFKTKTEAPKTADDYLADFDDGMKNGPEFENLDDYEDLL